MPELQSDLEVVVMFVSEGLAEREGFAAHSVTGLEIRDLEFTLVVVVAAEVAVDRLPRLVFGSQLLSSCSLH